MFYSINYDNKNKRNIKDIKDIKRDNNRKNNNKSKINNEESRINNEELKNNLILKNNPKTYLSEKEEDNRFKGYGDEFKSTNDKFKSVNNEFKNSNDVVPKYEVSKPNFSKIELNVLEELRENIVDLAISENMSSFNEKLILEDVNRFLKNRFPNLDEINRKILANNMFQELIGYGEIDSLIKDDNLEEIMVIGVGKPVFVGSMMSLLILFTIRSRKL